MSASERLRLSFAEVTRGRGKVFVHIECSAAGDDIVLRALAETLSGTPLPAEVMEPPDIGGWVVVLPVLEVAQRVTLSVCDGKGQVLLRRRKVVLPKAAMLASRINTILKNPVAARIRNCDETAGPVFGLTVGMDELICAPDSGIDVLRGWLRMRLTRPDDALPDLDVTVLDARGEDASLAPWQAMGTWQRDETGLVRTLPFSVRLRQDLPFLILWAKDQEGELSSFVCLEDFVLGEAREHSRGMALSASRDPAYHEWFMSRSRAQEVELALERAQDLAEGPVFSVVVPLYRTPLNLLDEMLDSLVSQTYPRLEIILVVASPEDAPLRSAVGVYAASDERIRVSVLEENLGIAGNSLAGMELATGDFVSFMDHDDVIEGDLFFRYARAILSHPDIDLLYCDEDKLREGRFVEPFFKPDWSPDLLRSQNYVCHLLTVRRSIADELPREGYRACEGSQDHFLALFAGERARRVWHERRVLYHWRVTPTSTAAGAGSKPYTIAAGVTAVQAHLTRLGASATARAREDVPGTYEVDWEVAGEPLVSIIIPNRDQHALLRRCIDSLRQRSTYRAFEVIIVENNSAEDETFALYGELECDERIRVVTQTGQEGFNFSRTVNFGAREARGSFLLFLNNDIEVVSEDWLERMLGHAQRPEVGAVGAKLVYPDGLIQHAGVLVHRGAMKHIGWKLDSRIHDAIDGYQLTRDVSAVTGACLMMRRSLFEELGGFDEALPNDFNDTNLCLELRARGLLVVFEPRAELIHHESVSRGAHETEELRCQYAYSNGVMMSRWPVYFALGDPYWSPHLWCEPTKHLRW